MNLINVVMHLIVPWERVVPALAPGAVGHRAPELRVESSRSPVSTRMVPLQFCEPIEDHVGTSFVVAFVFVFSILAVAEDVANIDIAIRQRV